MSLEVNVPELGESITEVQVSAWLKQPGEAVALDEPFIELESDKATVEVPAPAAGVLTEILVAEGEEAKVGDLLARIDTEATAKLRRDDFQLAYALDLLTGLSIYDSDDDQQ